MLGIALSRLFFLLLQVVTSAPTCLGPLPLSIESPPVEAELGVSGSDVVSVRSCPSCTLSPPPPCLLSLSNDPSRVLPKVAVLVSLFGFARVWPRHPLLTPLSPYGLCQVPFPRLTGPAPAGEYEEGYTCDANLARVYQLLDGFSLGNPVLVARAAMMVSPLACSVELLCFSVPSWLLKLLWNFVSSVVVRITVPQCHRSYGVFFVCRAVHHKSRPHPLGTSTHRAA